MWTFEGLLQDITRTVKTVTAVKDRVWWMPPAQAPQKGPWVWMETSATGIQASEEIFDIAVDLNVCVPMVGYSATDTGEYATVLQTALEIHRAFYTNTMINEEASLASEVAINKPMITEYGQSRHICSRVEFHLTATEDIGSQVTV